jgi:hypothetical protein
MILKVNKKQEGELPKPSTTLREMNVSELKRG